MMSPAIPQRKKNLYLASLITFLFCIWTAWRDQDSLVESTTHTMAHRTQPVKATSTANKPTIPPKPGGLLDRDPFPEATTDLFRLVSFQPPPPKAEPLPPPPPPPKPTAPAFPYTYFGRMVDINGNTITYLSRDDALIPIHPQQLLDNSYRIEAVTETQIVVTYVPLEEKIVIAVQSGK